MCSYIFKDYRMMKEKLFFLFTGNVEVSTASKHKQNSSKNIHYDTPKFQQNDECFTFKSNHDLVTSCNVDKNSINQPIPIMIINENVSIYIRFFFSISSLCLVSLR